MCNIRNFVEADLKVQFFKLGLNNSKVDRKRDWSNHFGYLSAKTAILPLLSSIPNSCFDLGK